MTKKLVWITPDPRDATRDFQIDESRIGSVEAQGLAAWSPDTKGFIPAHANAAAMLRRFATASRRSR